MAGNKKLRGITDEEAGVSGNGKVKGATAERLKRLDFHSALRGEVLPLCRLKAGEVWEDPVRGHRVGVLDATDPKHVAALTGGKRARLVVNDPPYNVAVGGANTANLFKLKLDEYLDFSRKWVASAIDVLEDDAHLYIWIGADYKDGLQPLPDFIILMRDFHELAVRNLITMRNQRGYGTQKNWMWVRQELLYYVKGSPGFNIDAEYTDIPKILRGYYKEVDGELTENLERGKSQYIRAGNVWVDVQQVFYRMEENVPGCYGQKPLKAIERIVCSASDEGETIVDFFAHAGTTLIAGERLNRQVYTCDIDPVFAEITIRRLENLRQTGKTGWQWRNPFPELEKEQ
ncbi:MAG: site-specific DNA-methyltransferase [Candidatus Aquicultor sp.]|nr:site-specific DNA-methyltransferase [Candidatus Aquicultor sp.]